MTLTRSVISGSIWNFVAQGVSQGAFFLLSVVLARSLPPEEFGLTGIILPLLFIANIIGDAGIGASVIQRKQLSNTYAATAFWINLIAGILLCCAGVITSPYIGQFFHAEQLGTTVRLLALAAPVQSLGIVHKAILSRKLAFKTVAIIEIAASVLQLVGTLISLALGSRIHSLSIGWLVSVGSASLLLWSTSDWCPKLRFSTDDLGDVLKFSGGILGARLVAYYNSNIDSLVIGRMLGPVSVGYYAIAYQITAFPRSRVANIFSRVIFPAFASIQSDNEKLRKGYLKLIKLISFVVFPIMTVLLAIAPSFIVAVYGEPLKPAARLLQFLCVAGMVTAVGTTVGAVFNSKGRPDLLLKIAIPRAIVYTLVLRVFTPLGVNAVAIAVVAYTLMTSIPLQLGANWLIELKLKEFLRTLAPAIVNSVLAGSFTLYLAFVLNHRFRLSDWLIVLVSTAMGSIVYLTIYTIKDTKELGEVMEPFSPFLKQIKFRLFRLTAFGKQKR